MCLSVVTSQQPRDSEFFRTKKTKTKVWSKKLDQKHSQLFITDKFKPKLATILARIFFAFIERRQLQYAISGTEFCSINLACQH